MDYTQNLHLPQWEADDRIMRTDFNDAMASIDTALAANTAALLGKGNCELVTGSYVGTGIYGEFQQTVFNFPGKPVVVFIGKTPYPDTNYRELVFLLRPVTWCYLGSTNTRIIVTWGETSVSLWAGSASTQLNETGTTYHYAALIQKA